MNIAQAKQIDLVSFMEQLNHYPVKIDRRGVVWYRSPFRHEEKPSFQIDPTHRMWYDYGAPGGGDIIALCKELYMTDDVSLILQKIARKIGGVITTHKDPVIVNSTVMPTITTGITDFETIELRNNALLSYLMSRKIDLTIAQKYCVEAHYNLGDKHYYGVAFKNNSGGYEIRNPYFKSCHGRKDITRIKANDAATTWSDKCCIFEGFIDFLSFLTCKKLGRALTDVEGDFIVLNSVVTIRKAIPMLKSYNELHIFLDNDNAGRKATLAISKNVDSTVYDQAYQYSNCKDINDYLIGKHINQRLTVLGITPKSDTNISSK